MKSNLSVLFAALVMGAVGGLVGGNLLAIKSAYAAPNVIALENPKIKDVAAKCDFSKTVILIGDTIVCMQR